MCPQIPRPSCRKQQVLEKAQDFEEDVRLPRRQGTSSKLRAKQNWLYLSYTKNAGCKVGVVLPRCSSHLLEKSLPGKARDEFLEREGGPTSSSSSQGRRGLRAPATGRPGGAKVRVRRGSARSQAELHGPGEPAGADRGRGRRTQAEGPFQPLTEYGRAAGKQVAHELAEE